MLSFFRRKSNDATIVKAEEADLVLNSENTRNSSYSLLTDIGYKSEKELKDTLYGN